MTQAQAQTKIKLSEKILPTFLSWYRATKKDKYLNFVLKGGRGSGKSSQIAIKFVLDAVRYPITLLCVRKVANTLSESCYEQIKEAVELLGLTGKFRFMTSPLQVVYLPRGNKIIFRGADDPAKIKSIKMAKFPIARLWIEELAEFKTEDEVTTIVNSVLRAELPEGLAYQIYYSYNPPKRKQSWVNKKYETQFIAPNTYVHHSTYLDNPYISAAFRDEAEHVKKIKPQKYEWEYLGKPVGSGVVPFGNLTFRKILRAEIAQFDNIRQGIDWGYAVDPFHFAKLHYDKTRRRIYIFDEIHEVKLSNRLAAEKMRAKGYQNELTRADGAEPKSIAEMKTYGIRIKPARKGPGSVEYGEKWLDDLDEIIIDPIRCPETAREFENIDYQVDKDGNPLARLEDKDNHSIDAVRYALSEDMTTRERVH